MFDITQIVIALIGVLASLITGFFIPWIKSKTTANQHMVAGIILENAVRAAEQIFYSGEAQEKKQFVLDYLASKKIAIDDAQIEATVHKLFGTEKNGAWDGNDDARGEIEEARDGGEDVAR